MRAKISWPKAWIPIAHCRIFFCRGSSRCAGVPCDESRYWTAGPDVGLDSCLTSALKLVPRENSVCAIFQGIH